MSHRQNSRISPSSVHCSYRFWTVTLSFCRERSASHEECYRFAGFWEPEGLLLLAGHHIVLQGIRKTSKCEQGPRLYGCTESIACCSNVCRWLIPVNSYTLRALGTTNWCSRVHGGLDPCDSPRNPHTSPYYIQL